MYHTVGSTGSPRSNWIHNHGIKHRPSIIDFYQQPAAVEKRNRFKKSRKQCSYEVVAVQILITKCYSEGLCVLLRWRLQHQEMFVYRLCRQAWMFLKFFIRCCAFLLLLLSRRSTTVHVSVWQLIGQLSADGEWGGGVWGGLAGKVELAFALIWQE